MASSTSASPSEPPIVSYTLSQRNPKCYVAHIILQQTLPNDANIAQLEAVFMHMHQFNVPFLVVLDTSIPGISPYVPFLKRIFTKQKALDDEGIRAGKPGLKKMYIVAPHAPSLVLYLIQNMLSTFFPSRDISIVDILPDNYRDASAMKS